MSGDLSGPGEAILASPCLTDEQPTAQMELPDLAVESGDRQGMAVTRCFQHADHSLRYIILTIEMSI